MEEWSIETEVRLNYVGEEHESTAAEKDTVMSAVSFRLPHLSKAYSKGGQLVRFDCRHVSVHVYKSKRRI